MSRLVHPMESPISDLNNVLLDIVRRLFEANPTDKEGIERRSAILHLVLDTGCRLFISINSICHLSDPDSDEMISCIRSGALSEKIVESTVEGVPDATGVELIESLQRWLYSLATEQSEMEPKPQ